MSRLLSIVVATHIAAALCACESVLPPPTEFASDANTAKAACSTALEPAASGDHLTIGAVLPMSDADGKPDARGLHRSRAMVLALSEVNQRAGVGDRLFRLRLCDKGGGWVSTGESAARQLASWLIDGEGVTALISGGSGDTLAIQAVARPKGALLMSVSATSMEIGELADEGLVWRVAPSDQQQGVVLAWLAEEALTKASSQMVAVMAISNPYGDGLNKVISNYLPVKNHTGYTLQADGSNLESELKRAAGDKPGVLIIAAPAGLAAQLINARSAHPELASAQVLLSDSAHNPDFLAAITDPKTLSGLRGTLPGAPEGPAYKTFKSRYMSKFKTDPGQQSFTAHSYDAAYCLALAHAWALGSAGKGLVEGKVQGKALVEGLQQLSAAVTPTTLEPTGFSGLRKSLMAGEAVNIEGASGPLDFDPDTGEAPSPVEVWSVNGAGAFVSDKWVRVVDKGGGTYAVTEMAAP